MLLSQFKQSLTDSYTAAVAGDYATALKHARAARIAGMAIPKTEFDREKIEFIREDFDAMIKNLETAATTQTLTSPTGSPGGPVQSAQIVYV